ncbi:hypothetical protein X743_01380 [Mesorhizobium sp. LNHC252B00]|nr:hypothetical protein X743_01380 [Mesorhizobium sp. LNHC252B00]
MVKAPMRANCSRVCWRLRHRCRLQLAAHPVAGRWVAYDPVQGNELGLTGSFGAFAGA